MLNNPTVKRQSYGNVKQILVDELNSTAVSCIVSDTGVTAGSDGVKVVKAGTPVYGSLLDRSTAMTVNAVTTGEGQSAVTTKVCGVVLHDVEVTDGPANSQIVIFGTIDVSKLETAVVTKLKAAVDDLKMVQVIAP